MRNSMFESFGWGDNPFTFNIMPELFVGYNKEVDNILHSVNNWSFPASFVLINVRIGASWCIKLSVVCEYMTPQQYQSFSSTAFTSKASKNASAVFSKLIPVVFNVQPG